MTAVCDDRVKIHVTQGHLCTSIIGILSGLLAQRSRDGSTPSRVSENAKIRLSTEDERASGCHAVKDAVRLVAQAEQELARTEISSSSG